MTPVFIDKKERTRHAPLNGAKTSRSRDADGDDPSVDALGVCTPGRGGSKATSVTLSGAVLVNPLFVTSALTLCEY